MTVLGLLNIKDVARELTDLIPMLQEQLGVLPRNDGGVEESIAGRGKGSLAIALALG